MSWFFTIILLSQIIWHGAKQDSDAQSCLSILLHFCLCDPINLLKQWTFFFQFALRYSSKRTLTHRLLSYVNFSAGLVHSPPWFALFHCGNHVICAREALRFMCATSQRLLCVSVAVFVAFPWFNGASLRFNGYVFTPHLGTPGLARGPFCTILLCVS